MDLDDLFSGGEKSLLFCFMVMRIAVKSLEALNECLFTISRSSATWRCFCIVLHIAHRSILIRYELPKILIIHGSNLYIAIAARAEELLGQPMYTMLHQSKVDATPHPWEACPV